MRPPLTVRRFFDSTRLYLELSGAETGAWEATRPPGWDPVMADYPPRGHRAWRRRGGGPTLADIYLEHEDTWAGLDAIQDWLDERLGND